MFLSASPRESLRVSGKQNLLFALGPVIKCFTSGNIEGLGKTKLVWSKKSSTLRVCKMHCSFVCTRTRESDSFALHPKRDTLDGFLFNQVNLKFWT